MIEQTNERGETQNRGRATTDQLIAVFGSQMKHHIARCLCFDFLNSDFLKKSTSLLIIISVSIYNLTSSS